MSNLSIFAGRSVTPISGKPTKISAGKKDDPDGKITIHVGKMVPLTRKDVTDALTAAKVVKVTQTAKIGGATGSNTVYLTGSDAAGVAENIFNMAE